MSPRSLLLRLDLALVAPALLRCTLLRGILTKVSPVELVGRLDIDVPTARSLGAWHIRETCLLRLVVDALEHLRIREGAEAEYDEGRESDLHRTFSLPARSLAEKCYLSYRTPPCRGLECPGWGVLHWIGGPLCGLVGGAGYLNYQPADSVSPMQSDVTGSPRGNLGDCWGAVCAW